LMAKDISVIQVQLGDRSYPIHIGSGTLDILQEKLTKGPNGSKCVLVTDEKVYSIYSDRINSMVRAMDPPAEIYIAPEGENSKSFGRLEDLCRTLAQRGLDRDSLIVALGGGVVGDLAGFAAAIFLRGGKVIQVPTTLLSMVDSSTGGKTGINLPEGKNLVGTFYQPSGMAEVIKISLTLDPELFDYLEKVEDLGPEGGVDTQRIVDASCRRKAEVVAVDEKEAGPRVVLNFGHTLAHALESSEGYGEIRHGEAVAIGMRAALSLSKKICGLDEAQYKRAMAVIEKIPVPDVGLDQNLEQFLSRDKKRVGGRVQSVLLEEIGKYRIVQLDDPGILVAALQSEEHAE
jgi:3-dehydroquinate synthase